MRLELRTPRPGYVTDFRLLPALRDFAVASDASLPRMEFESASIRAIRVNPSAFFALNFQLSTFNSPRHPPKAAYFRIPRRHANRASI